MKFQFQLEGEHLNSNQWAFENGYIKGDLQIYVNGAAFIDEPNMNVVELAVQLGRWLDSIRHDVMRDFVYKSFNHDEPILFFIIEQEGVRISSSWQKFELVEAQPLDVVMDAVKMYLVHLNYKLHEINYIEKLDRYITESTSENSRALMLFEQNEYKEAFALFKKVAKEAPSVQSLNNLAWIYLREEEDMDEAERVLQQVLTFQPQSSFPYMMLGEISLFKQRYDQAKSYLQQALAFSGTEEATYNLAIAHYQLSEFKSAAEMFARCVGESGMTQLHEVVAWMHAGERDKAKALLDGWNEDAYDYTGAIEIADVYMELGCFAEAREQFKKEWSSYVHSPYLVGRFGYTLMQLGDMETCGTLVQVAIQQTNIEITEEEDAEIDEHWSREDQKERIEELKAQKMKLETMFERLQNGFKPAFEYEMYPMGGCQLFGCIQHGNPEYEGA